MCTIMHVHIHLAIKNFCGKKSCAPETILSEISTRNFIFKQYLLRSRTVSNFMIAQCNAGVLKMRPSKDHPTLTWDTFWLFLARFSLAKCAENFLVDSHAPGTSQGAGNPPNLTPRSISCAVHILGGYSHVSTSWVVAHFFFIPP